MHSGMLGGPFEAPSPTISCARMDCGRRSLPRGDPSAEAPGAVARTVYLRCRPKMGDRRWGWYLTALVSRDGLSASPSLIASQPLRRGVSERGGLGGPVE